MPVLAVWVHEHHETWEVVVVVENPVQPRRAQANEGLLQLGQALRGLDCFDNEDLQIWQEEISRFEEVDKELLALQELLPQRQRHLAELDAAFGLSQYFPLMMRKFASKDAELQSILDAKLRKKREQYRAVYE